MSSSNCPMHPCVYPYNFTLRHLTASQSLTEAELKAEDAADIPDMERAGRASSAARLGHDHEFFRRIAPYAGPPCPPWPPCAGYLAGLAVLVTRWFISRVRVCWRPGAGPEAGQLSGDTERGDTFVKERGFAASMLKMQTLHWQFYNGKKKHAKSQELYKFKRRTTYNIRYCSSC